MAEQLDVAGGDVQRDRTAASGSCVTHSTATSSTCSGGPGTTASCSASSGRVSSLPEQWTVSVAGSGDGQIQGKYVGERARRTRCPGSKRWPAQSSLSAMSSGRPGSTGSARAWPLRCVRLRMPRVTSSDSPSAPRRRGVRRRTLRSYRQRRAGAGPGSRGSRAPGRGERCRSRARAHRPCADPVAGSGRHRGTSCRLPGRWPASSDTLSTRSATDPEPRLRSPSARAREEAGGQARTPAQAPVRSAWYRDGLSYDWMYARTSGSSS